MDTQELVVPGIALSKEDIEIGEFVADTVAADRQLNVEAVFWWFDEDSRVWKLAIASEFSRRQGHLKAYKRIRELLQKSELLKRFRFEQIWAIDDSHYVLAAVLGTVRPVAHSSFERCIFNGVSVTGMYFLYVKQKRRIGPRRKS